MKGVPINAASGGGERDSLERAADQALGLRTTLAELPDPLLREIIDVLLLEIGRRLAVRVRRGPRADPLTPSDGRSDVLGEVIEAIERCRHLD